MIIINKPILYKQNAFDSTKENSFYYTYSGAQQFKVKLIIYNNATNVKVYENIQTTFQLQYVLPANSIANGSDYCAQIIIYDKDNNTSPISEKTLFTCFLTPSFSISNLIPNQIIGDSVYDVEISFSQVTGELLDYYIVNLIDFSGNIIKTSGSLYFITYGLVYRLGELLDNTSYKIQVIGRTLNGMLIETPMTPFSVEYIKPAEFSLVNLENIPREGSIKFETNIVIVEGKSNPVPPIFINNEEVDLANPNHWVQFDEGFNIQSNFTIGIECRKIPKNTTFFKLSDGNVYNEIVIQKWAGIFEGNEKEYFVLYVKNEILSYRGASNLIFPLVDDETIVLKINKINNLYNINVVKKVV